MSLIACQATGMPGHFGQCMLAGDIIRPSLFWPIFLVFTLFNNPISMVITIVVLVLILWFLLFRKKESTKR